jgi:DNA-binding SARP family transcriptional activator
LLWGDDPNRVNPENALRTTLHRTRNLLEGLWPGAGKALILFQEGGYIWNDAVPVVTDFQRFEQLCEQKTVPAWQEALKLYAGEFLVRYSSESWVIPLSTHFSNLFLETSISLAEALSASGDHKEAAECCRRAAGMEPYHEPLYRLLMQELAASGDREGAAAVYQALSQRLFDDFGVRPNAQTREVYRQTVHSPSDRILPLEEVMEHLQEAEPVAGALQCDYDYFKVLCHVESRAMERNGNVTHIVLLSLAAEDDKPLTKRSQNRIMEQLGEQIRTNLRRGDIFSRCSVSQYILMLPKANYENSCMVCRRVIAAFYKTHPHVTAKINYMVQPLTPGICVP